MFTPSSMAFAIPPAISIARINPTNISPPSRRLPQQLSQPSRRPIFRQTPQPLQMSTATPDSTPDMSPTTRTSPSPPPPPTLSASVGTSTATSTDVAVAEAVQTALAGLSCEPTAAIITTTVDRDITQVQHALRETLPPQVAIHGATTCAAALTNDGAASAGISILLLHAPAQLAVATCAATDVDSGDDDGGSGSGGGVMEAARRAAVSVSEALEGDVGQLLLFASPGSEEGVLQVLAEQLPNVPVFGGSAADNTVEGKWCIFSESAMFDEGVSLMALRTSVKFGASLIAPYEATQTSALITAAKGRCIYALDGEVAATVLHKWMGSCIDKQVQHGGNIIIESASFPLGIERVEGTFVGVHAAEIVEGGGIGLFAEVAVGDRLTVMSRLGDADAATAAEIGLELAYDRAMEAGGLTQPKAGLLIYCGGLSIAVADDLDKSLRGMKNKAPVLGMTAFGEQGCFDGQNVHANLSVGIALFE